MMRLGILGGMGPMATADFFKKVIELTDATKDQEHIHILIDNNTEIPDRTGYLLNHGEDPRREMIRSAIKLEMMGADVIAIPCNTAHYFYDAINAYTDIPVIHMIEETAKHIKTMHPDQKKFLLLATTGTYEAEVYKTVFEAYGLEVIEPDSLGKALVMEWIYQVKASKLDVTADDFRQLVNRTVEDASMPLILGCTELPVLVQMLNLDGAFVDPTKILAERCVAFAKERNQMKHPTPLIA